jgi:hypothetical protein
MTLDDWLKSIGYRASSHGSVATLYPEDVDRLRALCGWQVTNPRYAIEYSIGLETRYWAYDDNWAERIEDATHFPTREAAQFHIDTYGMKAMNVRPVT